MSLSVLYWMYSPAVQCVFWVFAANCWACLMQTVELACCKEGKAYKLMLILLLVTMCTMCSIKTTVAYTYAQCNVDCSWSCRIAKVSITFQCKRHVGQSAFLKGTSSCVILVYCLCYATTSMPRCCNFAPTHWWCREFACRRTSATILWLASAVFPTLWHPAAQSAASGHAAASQMCMPNCPCGSVLRAICQDCGEESCDGALHSLQPRPHICQPLRDVRHFAATHDIPDIWLVHTTGVSHHHLNSRVATAHTITHNDQYFCFGRAARSSLSSTNMTHNRHVGPLTTYASQS